MTDDQAIKPAVKWTIVILALAALGLSLWLTVQKLTGKIDSLAGCGAGSGCANVLGSKWSVVFGVIPVSVFSSLLYLAILASLRMHGNIVAWFRLLAAWMLIVAALWFSALQWWVLHAICQYCMTMHGLGVALGILLLFAGRGRGIARTRHVGAFLLALVLVTGLAIVQHFGPEPESHRIDDAKDTGDLAVLKDSVHSAGEGRLVSFLGGGKSYRVDQLPHMGSPDAEHVLVKYFDYKCEACGRAHDYLESIMKKYPGKLAVVVLPVPLERQCNPHLPRGVEDHQDACKLAKLALRVWHADRAAFAEFHRGLFEYHSQPYEVAEAMAYSLVGIGKLEAVDESWVETVLEQNIADYELLVKKTPVMPKLLIKGSLIMQGVAKDRETLELLLQQELGLAR